MQLRPWMPSGLRSAPVAQWRRRNPLAGIVAVFPNPFAQDILVDIKITSSLRNSDPTFPGQLHCFKLILAAEYSSLHFMLYGFRRNP